MFDEPYYTCVLWSCSCQRAYILVTHDPAESLREHNLGSYPTTANQRPWKLAHTREFRDYGGAKAWHDRLRTADQQQRLLELVGLDPARFRS